VRGSRERSGIFRFWGSIGLQGLAVVASVFWVVFRSGAGLFESLPDEMVAADNWPSVPATYEGATYRWGNPFGYIVYQILDTPGQSAFVLQQVTVIIFALVITAWFLVKQLGLSNGLSGIRLIILGPLGAVLVVWLGIYDGYSLLLWSLFLIAFFYANRLLLFTVSAFVGFQHFDQAVFAIILFCVTTYVLGFIKKGQTATFIGLLALSGAFIGKIIQGLILMHAGTNVGTGSFFRIFGHATNATYGQIEIYNALIWLPALIWSAFAGLWLLVLYIFLKGNLRRSWLLAIALAGVFAISARTGDKTRVFAMITFISLVVLIVYFMKNVAKPSDKKIVELMVWVSLPVVIFADVVLPFGWRGSLLEENFVFLPGWFGLSPPP